MRPDLTAENLLHRWSGSVSGLSLGQHGTYPACCCCPVPSDVGACSPRPESADNELRPGLTSTSLDGAVRLAGGAAAGGRPVPRGDPGASHPSTSNQTRSEWDIAGTQELASLLLSGHRAAAPLQPRCFSRRRSPSGCYSCLRAT